MNRPTLCFVMFFLVGFTTTLSADDNSIKKLRHDPQAFNDGQFANIVYPSWFKQSFLDLEANLTEAIDQGKRGIIVFFSTRRCSYCEVFLDRVWGQPEIREKTLKYFDVTAIEIFSDDEVTDFDRKSLWAKDFAKREQAVFTPTLVFYGKGGKRLLKIVGYYPPEKFNAILDYVIEGHYQRESLRAFLAAKRTPGKVTGRGLIGNEHFKPPPYHLDRSVTPAINPLLVIFEKPNCLPCEHFHRETLKDKVVRKRMSKFDVVQLNMHDTEANLIIPGGSRLTPDEWASQLGLVYAPSLVFFDVKGKEVLRLDSTFYTTRMRGSLLYILEKAYIGEPLFQRWRRKNVAKDRVK